MRGSIDGRDALRDFVGHAEWLIEADHTGPLVLSEEAELEPTGRRVQLPGVTVADFRDGKIKSYRTYFDDISLIEQIVDG